MEKTMKCIKFKIDDLELWTAPFGDHLATLSAMEGGAKKLLWILHKKQPELFQLFVEDDEFCEADYEGTFSVIVDPERVRIQLVPGSGKMIFSLIPEGEPKEELEEIREGEADE